VPGHVRGLADGDSRIALHLSDAVDRVVDEIGRHDLRNVALVGHGRGGYPIIGAATRSPGPLTA
jgi:hypothetical protein